MCERTPGDPSTVNRFPPPFRELAAGGGERDVLLPPERVAHARFRQPSRHPHLSGDGASLDGHDGAVVARFQPDRVARDVAAREQLHGLVQREVIGRLWGRGAARVPPHSRARRAGAGQLRVR